MNRLCRISGFKHATALFAVLFVFAEFVEAGVTRIGRFAGEFLDMGAGARALAMGGTGVAICSEATSGYHNPARLSGIAQNAAEFMHASYFENTYTYDFLGFARPLHKETGLGATILYARVGDIPLTSLQDPSRPLGDDNRVVVRDMTSNNELALMVSAGTRGPWGWSWGGTAKLLYKGVAGKSAYGIGFDIALARTLGRGVAVGFALRDATGSALAWTTGRTEIIAPSIIAGGAWSAELPSLHADLCVMADFRGRFESRAEAEVIHTGALSVEPRFGAEYLISKVLALRGGLMGDNITAGAGLSVSSVTLDYAFQPHEELGNTHRVSLGLSWK
ncbi:MAG: PorV/PorQ family protein [Calditrichaeota bacterium]|nr:PorV/PorQ family protein [Calditrichota bacterium]